VSLLVSCGYEPPAVPVSGDPASIAALVGEWSGSYAGRESGRTGSIFFRLASDADSAYGDVLMAPAGFEHPLPEGRDASLPPPLLAIRFVRAEGDVIYGQLGEYEDPACGCRLKTTYTGRIAVDRIEGTFTTLHIDTGVRHAGVWQVTRTAEPSVAFRPRAPEADTARAEPLEPVEPGLKGPDEAELVAQGRELFSSLGCANCHGFDRRGLVGPDLNAVTEHRTFGWIYRMILVPDSMLTHDPTARTLLSGYGVRMPDVGASPWEALVLYEYLLRATDDTLPPGDARPEEGSERE
jgi:hypothetical protein